MLFLARIFSHSKMAAYVLFILLVGPGHGTSSEVNMHPIP